MADIRRARPALKRRVIAVLRDHYRRHRRLPGGPLTALARRRACADVVLWGEIEHRLCIAAILAWVCHGLGLPAGDATARLPASIIHTQHKENKEGCKRICRTSALHILT